MAASFYPRLTVRNLTKRYGQIEAVRDVSFEVGPGEIFGLIGPNGAGKTSVVECLLGLRAADSGTLLLDNIDIQRSTVSARAQIGAQLQFANLQDKITPREALKVFAAFYRNAASVDSLLQEFSLEEKADIPFNSLSGGQKQRLFLALALVNHPRLLVLDEPTSGLDPLSRRGLHAMIRNLKADGRSVLLCTHYLEEAHQLCDRIGIMHAGRLVAVDRPDALIAGAKVKTQLKIQTKNPLIPEGVERLPAVLSHRTAGNGWVLQTSDLNRTISSLAQVLQDTGNELIDMQIIRPSLEDVFLNLTNTAWAETP